MDVCGYNGILAWESPHIFHGLGNLIDALGLIIEADQATGHQIFLAQGDPSFAQGLLNIGLQRALEFDPKVLVATLQENIFLELIEFVNFNLSN